MGLGKVTVQIVLNFKRLNILVAPSISMTATPPPESMSSCLGTSKNQRDNAGRNRLPMNNEGYNFFNAAGNETN